MLAEYSPVMQALLGTLFTWGATAAGALVVFLIPKSIHPKSERRLLDLALGFSGGVMLAASFWSLLEPAFKFAEQEGWNAGGRTLSWVPVAIGFIAGAAFVLVTDILLPEDADSIAAAMGGGVTPSSLATQTAAKSVADSDEIDADVSTKTLRRRRGAARGDDDDADDNNENTAGNTSSRGRSTSRGRSRKSSSSTSTSSASTSRSSSRSRGAKSKSNSSKELVESRTVASASASPSATAAAAAAAAMSKSWRRVLLLIIAVTVHNFPEGLAVGVGFGGAAEARNTADAAEAFGEARNLAIGIGLQNLPEGMAVALPLMRLGYSPLRAFFYGQLSGFFEVIAGLLGVQAVMLARSILPFAMSFAAGAMVFVVAEQLIPEAHKEDDVTAADDDAADKKRSQTRLCAALSKVPAGTVASVGLVIGFVIMMVMDVTL